MNSRRSSGHGSSSRGSATVRLLEPKSLHTKFAPLQNRTTTLFVPIPAGAKGPLTVKAQLLFRPYPPHLLRLLGLDELAKKLSITTMASAAATVEL